MHWLRDPPIFISTRTVSDRLASEIALKVQPLAALVRQMELDRLDHYLNRLDPKIEAGDEKAINTALRVGESRRKLLGLDAPTQSESLNVTATVGSELVALIAGPRLVTLCAMRSLIAAKVIGDICSFISSPTSATSVTCWLYAI